MPKPKRIFISHSSKDRDFVEREVISLLTSHDIETWYSKDDIQTADYWERSIRKALKECDWFLVVVSEKSIDSDWVHREVSWADRNRKGRIIPVVLDGSDPSDLSLVLEGLQHVEFGLDLQDARVRLFKTWGMQVASQREAQPKTPTIPSQTSSHAQPTTPINPGPTQQTQLRKKPDGIELQCPNGHELAADESLFGKLAQCPICSAQFEMPKSGERRTAVLEVIRNSIGMKLALIPAGDLLMGSPNSDNMALDLEKPQHQVKITKPFLLGVTPVTQEEYERIKGSNPSRFTGEVGRPVEQVSWFDAVEFCNKLSKMEDLPPYYAIDGQTVSIVNGSGYRLPTEAEWEYACRAGTTTTWSFGNDESQLAEYGWYDANSGDESHSVGGKTPNPWGLHDMHGNVWEWCWDWGAAYRSGLVTDPLGPMNGAGRVLRGGTFSHQPANVRSAFRTNASPLSRWTHAYGFRLARDCNSSS